MNQQKSKTSIPVLILAVGCFILAGAVVTLVIRQFYPGVLAMWLSSPDQHVDQAKVATGMTEPQESTLPTAALDFEAVERLMGTLPPGTRSQVLADSSAFAEAVRREAARRSVLRAALDSDLASNEQIAYLGKRAAEQVLVNGYVQLHTNANVPDGFPSDDQIQVFYDQNKTGFTVGERVLLWQVFIPTPENSNSAAVTEKEKYATELATQIRDGTLSFTDAALEHTGHEASRLQGGFMGFLNVSQLVPEVRDALPELAEGDVSEPIRGKDGYHIIRRGPLIPAQTLPLPQVKEQVRTQLRQAAQRKSQQAMLNTTHEKFGHPPSEQDIEGWRLRLNGQN